MIVPSVSPDTYTPGPSSIISDSTPPDTSPNPELPTIPATTQPATHPQHPAQEHTGTGGSLVLLLFCAVLC